MSAAAPLARRPLGCCFQASSRQALALRQFATSTPKASTNPSPATAAASVPSSFQAIMNKSNGIRTAFAVYDPPPRTTKPASALIPRQTFEQTYTLISSSSNKAARDAKAAADAAKAAKEKETEVDDTDFKLDVRRILHKQQIARMDPTGARTQLFARTNPFGARPGDVVLVTPNRPDRESFGGVLLAVRYAGIETAILLRGRLAKTGVEMWFKIYSRSIASIDVVQRRQRRIRRSKLYYMRQPKHDRGSVEELIKAFRRTRTIGGRPRSGAAKPKQK